MAMRTPGIARRRSITKSRRRRYSASMMVTDSCGPVTASTAAFRAIEVGFDVLWLCSFAIAEITGDGANAKPMRHPVIEYVFDNDPATNTRSFAPGIAAMENGSSD